ncbi:MAG: NAD(P)-binding domain-containing protein [Bacteroidetes bacterium]|nr:NAD(P)-binding domain-containing protein [Bacteroidota bacterium]
MKIAVIGTGMVGATIGSGLIALGHEVMMGSRTRENQKAIEWKKSNGSKASNGTFFEAASFGEIIFNCTSGQASLEALQLAGRENLSGKVLVDIANPLDFSGGMPPSLSICNTDSLGEAIQRQFPDVKVVKTLNTVNCSIMINPSSLSEPTSIFVSGNDESAKSTVKEILSAFGWKDIIDLGDITTARGTEQLLPIWIRLMVSMGTPTFNFRIVK